MASDCGESGALSVRVRLAVRVPPTVGAKVTLIVQVAPAAMVAGDTGQVEVWAKSPALVPLRAMVVMASAALPVLVTVTFCAALVVPTAWLAKPSVAGERDTPGTGVVVPVPDSGTPCGLPAASSVMVTAALRTPAAVGVK